MKADSIFRRARKSAEYGPGEALAQIKEGSAYAAEHDYDPDMLHCKGCIYACAFSKARCDTGRKAVPVLAAKKNNKM